MGSGRLYCERALLAFVALVVVGNLTGCNDETGSPIVVRNPSTNSTPAASTNSTTSMNSTTSTNSTSTVMTTTTTSTTSTAGGLPVLQAPVEIPLSHQNDMVAHMANHKENAELFYQQAIIAIDGSISEMTQGAIEPGRRLTAATSAEIISSISTFGAQLFLGVEKLLPANARSHEYFSQFRDAWLDLFSNLGAESATLVTGIEDYIAEAKPEKLIVVINECIALAKKVVESFLPAEIYEEIEKYLEGVVRMYQSLSTGWTLLADGHQGDGVVQIYDGVRAGLELILPSTVTSDETYMELMQFLDDAVSRLTGNIAMFMKRLTENHACWRKKLSRGSEKPQECTAFAGYVWDQAWQCIKPNNDPFPALCDASSEYTSIIGENEHRRCYKECDSGLQPLEASETECATTCSGERSVAGKFGIASRWDDMCGTNEQVLLDIRSRIVTKSIQLVFNTVSGIANMVQQKRFVGDSMNAIIQSALDFAAEFVFPNCDASGNDEPRRLLALPTQHSEPLFV